MARTKSRAEIVKATDRALVRQMARVAPPKLKVEPPKHVFILSGGLGAGKTTIVNRLKADFHFVSGSPADVMKEALAKHINEQYNGAEGWELYYEEMLDQSTKAEYRLLLQGFGEFFSNRDQSYWADQCVASAANAYENLAAAGVPSGIVFDSIRRPQEILAVKERWPEAKHVHLVISYARQMEYLIDILGQSEAKAEDTLAHSSEHWLDDMDGKPYDAEYVINADESDNATWAQMMGVVVLMMDKVTLELAAAIATEGDEENV